MRGAAFGAMRGDCDKYILAVLATTITDMLVRVYPLWPHHSLFIDISQYSTHSLPCATPQFTHEMCIAHHLPVPTLVPAAVQVQIECVYVKDCIGEVYVLACENFAATLLYCEVDHSEHRSSQKPTFQQRFRLRTEG